MSLPWATVPHGLIGDLRIQPRHPPYNRCLHWHVEWDTRCVRSPDSRMPNADLRGVVCSLIRIEVFTHKHGPAGTTRGSSVSVVENLVTCKPADQDRILPFHSNRQVGIFNLITGHNTTEATIRETLRRPGPHPHRSMRTSLDPLVIFMHHIDSNRSITGYYDHTYSSTFEFMKQKHARQPWIGIMWNHRRCLHRTLRKIIHWSTRIR